MTLSPDNTSALASKSLVLARYLSSFRQHIAGYRDRDPPVYVDPFALGAPAVAPPPDGLRTPAEAARKPRKLTLASIAKQASKAGIEVSRYEVKPDGTVVVTGKPEPAEPENPWRQIKGDGFHTWSEDEISQFAPSDRQQAEACARAAALHRAAPLRRGPHGAAAYPRRLAACEAGEN